MEVLFEDLSFLSGLNVLKKKKNLYFCHIYLPKYSSIISYGLPVPPVVPRGITSEMRVLTVCLCCLNLMNYLSFYWSKHFVLLYRCKKCSTKNERLMDDCEHIISDAESRLSII